MPTYQDFSKPLLAEGLNKIPEDTYRAKLKAMEDLINQSATQKQNDTINEGEGSAFGKAIDTATAPTMGVGNALLGVKPTNYGNAENIINAYQAAKAKGSEGRTKDLLDTYKSTVLGENVAQDYSKQRADALGKGAALEAGLIEAREKAKAKPVTLNLTPGQKAQDVAVGKEKAEYDHFGGSAEVASQLETLTGLNNDLKKGEIASGGLINKYVTSNYPGSGLYVAKEKIATAVQNTMRPILGAQFTENEGKRIIDNAFDPGVSTQENARRIDSLILKLKRIDAAKRAAFAYFDEHGTVAGKPHEDYLKLKDDLTKDAYGLSESETNTETNTASEKMKKAASYSKEQMIDNIKKKLAGK